MINGNQNIIHPVFDQLYKTIREQGERIAIIEKNGEELNFSDLKNQIGKTFNYLQSKGIGKGVKVIVLIPMSKELYLVMEALFALGATVVFIDPWMKYKSIKSAVKLSEARFVISTPKVNNILNFLPFTWQLIKLKSPFNLIDQNADFQIQEVAGNDDALITFTSGTSSIPKGVNRSFQFLLEQSKVLRKQFDLIDKNEITYTNFPIVGLIHLELGQSFIIPSLKLTNITKNNFQSMVDEIACSKVTRLIVSPFLLKQTLELLPNEHKIQKVITGGGPVSASLVHRSLKFFPEIEFKAIYGSTEAEPISIASFEDVLEHTKDSLNGLFVGKPVPEIQLKIIEINDSSKTALFKELIDGETGEIIVTGKHVNKGYYKNEDAFNKYKIKDEKGLIWHRTGDLGYIYDGNLFLVGNINRIIQHKGKNYYPFPVEQWLEVEFGLSDVGYVQNRKDEILLYLYTTTKIKKEQLFSAFESKQLPLDKIVLKSKPLPRDARHGSKLLTSKL